MEIPDETYAPDVCTEKKQLRESVQAGLSKLAPQQREILVLREIGGLRYDEIGRQLNLEEGTVKSRIFRARKKLCEILSKDGNISSQLPSKKLREEGADSK
jgi:RNA polymerase sigma-70 factor (ECF subfamily)